MNITNDENKYIKGLMDRDNLITETRQFLEEVSIALNMLKNQKIPGTNTKTYDLASKLDKLLKKWKQ